MIQHYELMFLLPGSIAPEEVSVIQDRILGMITDHGGTITSQYNMERRRLSYMIKQQNFGYYYLAQFDIDAEPVQALDTKLRLNSEVLRYLLVKAVPKTNKELQTLLELEVPAEPKSELADIANALPAEPIAAAVVPAVVVAPIVAEAPVVEAVPEVPVTDPEEEVQVSIEELNQKLDAILEDSDLETKL